MISESSIFHFLKRSIISIRDLSITTFYSSTDYRMCIRVLSKGIKNVLFLNKKGINFTKNNNALRLTFFSRIRFKKSYITFYNWWDLSKLILALNFRVCHYFAVRPMHSACVKDKNAPNNRASSILSLMSLTLSLHSRGS